jgi:dTDP-4-amino-4,6-dideoxygalactose transaminase
MIKLFNIPHNVVDTLQFNNLLFDDCVTELENSIAKYVGAKYAVGINSASNAIFLSLKFFGKSVCKIPSLVTTRFLHYVKHSEKEIQFVDNVDWIGRDYKMCDGIIDSAQRLSPNQFKEYNTDDLCIFSFYPTKPVSGICGGMVVSNNKQKIDRIRMESKFGEKLHTDSWYSKPLTIGYQMFLTTIPAYIALQNFKLYPEKRKRLDEIRKIYRDNLPSHLDNNSYHLFRILVESRDEFIKYMLKNKIICGVHYEPAHLVHLYKTKTPLLKSEYYGERLVSIPFHEKLSDSDIHKVIEKIVGWKK